MRLAPLYQQEKEQTFQQGLEQGLQQGLGQGLQQGEQQEASKLVIRQLQRRFGDIPQNIQETIKGLSVERLEDLGIAFLDFKSIEDLTNWLS